MTGTTEPPHDAPLAWRTDRAVAVSPDDTEVWLFGGAGPVRLAGSRAGALARAVDGRRGLTALVAQACAAGMTETDADRIARRWVAAGHLQEAPSPGAAPAGVCIVDRSTDDNGALLAPALELAGVEVRAVAQPGDVTVVVVDDLLDAPAAVADVPRPALAVQLRGDRPLVSPLLGRTAACPDCLASRLAARRRADLVAAHRTGRAVPPPSPVRHRRAVPLAAGVIAATVTSIAGHADQAGPWTVVAIEPDSAAVTHHRLVPLAGCPECDPGGPSVNAEHLTAPPPSTGRVRRAEAVDAGSGGGYRVIDPDETWRRHADLVSDVVGVVPYVRPTGPPELRAFSSGPNAAAADDLVLMRSRLRSASGGKGLTLAGARTGALAEALERDSLRARGNEPVRHARMGDLEGAIHPNALQLFSERQVRRAALLQAWDIDDPGTHGHHRVPLPFDTEAEHDWTAVADIRTGEVRWVLSSLVWLGHPGVGTGYPSGSSNGAAAGNTLEEALLQGLLERVERDSVALWWHPRCHRPAIDLAAWDDPRIEAALAPQRALGSDVWVLDLTSDLGVPAAVAVARGVAPLPDVPLLGFGAHLDPVLAVVRALTELAQMQAPLTLLSSGAPLELPGPAEQAWFAEVTPESEPWLAPHGTVPPTDSPQYDSVAAALDDLVDRLTSRNLEVLWADCTRPDIGLPVVRTWVPGLRHFWNRYAPGRLYDVPPALGWIDGGYVEDDLNPRAMIL